MKLCSKVRAYKDTDLPKCPYFPDSESIEKYFNVTDAKLQKLRKQQCYKKNRVCPYGKEFVRRIYFEGSKQEICQNCAADYNPPPPMVEFVSFGGVQDWVPLEPMFRDWLEKYVTNKLTAAGVFHPEDINPANPAGIGIRIVYESHRQAWHALERAEELIRIAIKFPPDPINERHFSLKAFAQMKR